MRQCTRCKGTGIEWFMIGSIRQDDEGNPITGEAEPIKDVCSVCDGVGQIDDESLNMEDDNSDDDPPENLSNLVPA